MPLILSSTELLTLQAVSNSLYGIRGLGLSFLSPELSSLISAFTFKIESCPQDFDRQSVGNSLYGMMEMKSDSAALVTK